MIIEDKIRKDHTGINNKEIHRSILLLHLTIILTNFHMNKGRILNKTLETEKEIQTFKGNHIILQIKTHISNKTLRISNNLNPIMQILTDTIKITLENRGTLSKILQLTDRASLAHRTTQKIQKINHINLIKINSVLLVLIREIPTHLSKILVTDLKESFRALTIQITMKN